MDRVLDFLLIGYLISIACVVLVVLLVFLERGGPAADPGRDVLRRHQERVQSGERSVVEQAGSGD